MEICKIEYQVRPITRFIVTRYVAGGDMSPACSEVKGEYDNEQLAFEIGTALAKDERLKRGWALDDERMAFPKSTSVSMRDAEAEGVYQSERIAAVLETYQAALADADPGEPEHEVRLFDAMKAAVAHADATSARR